MTSSKPETAPTGTVPEEVLTAELRSRIRALGKGEHFFASRERMVKSLRCEIKYPDIVEGQYIPRIWAGAKGVRGTLFLNTLGNRLNDLIRDMVGVWIYQCPEPDVDPVDEPATGWALYVA